MRSLFKEKLYLMPDAQKMISNPTMVDGRYRIVIESECCRGVHLRAV